jgi:hypothetical protein
MNGVFIVFSASQYVMQAKNQSAFHAGFLGETGKAQWCYHLIAPSEIRPSASPAPIASSPFTEKLRRARPSGAAFKLSSSAARATPPGTWHHAAKPKVVRNCNSGL